MENLGLLFIHSMKLFCLLLFVGISWVPLVAFDKKANEEDLTDPPTILPNRKTAEIICVTDEWAVWRTHEIVKGTKGFRGFWCHLRFYRQRLGEPEAKFAFRREDSVGFGRGMKIGPDGTLVFRDYFKNEHIICWFDMEGILTRVRSKTLNPRIYRCDVA